MRSKSLILCSWMVALVVVTGCSRVPDDHVIAMEIKAKMFSDAELKLLPIDLAVKSGTVTLTGMVPSAEAQLKAYKLAAATPGVIKVIDEMKVRPVAAKEPDTARAQEPLFPTTTVAALVRSAPPVRKPEVSLILSVKKADPKPEPIQNPVQPPPAPAAAEAPAKAEVPTAAEGESPINPESTAAVLPETPPAPAEEQKGEPPRLQKVKVEIPAGYPFRVRMVDAIDSANNKVGDSFRATLEGPVIVTGWEVVPKKTPVYLELVEAGTAGRNNGQNQLELTLRSMELGGENYRLSSESGEQVRDSRGKDSVAKVGVAAGIGTAIGAIVGGGKGAAIGAIVGASTGVVIAGATRGQQGRISSETKLEFRLKAPVLVTYFIDPSSKS